MHGQQNIRNCYKSWKQTNKFDDNRITGFRTGEAQSVMFLNGKTGFAE